MIRKILITAGIIIVLIWGSYAQHGLGTNNPDVSSVIDAVASDKGILIPRVALTGTGDLTTVTSPATSLLVYNTATAGSGAAAVEPGYYYFDGTKWVKLALKSEISGEWSDAGSYIYATDAKSAGTDVIVADWGAIGIGTSTPNFKLELAGTTSVSDRKIGINGTQSVYLPDQDAAAFQGSLIIGDGGGSLSHSSGVEGQWNTFVGLSNGISNTTGLGNSSLGFFTLRENTTGTANVAVGGYALRQNTTGNRNTALGYRSLMNSNGNENVAIGFQAAEENYSGQYNVAIGNYAGLGNPQGTLDNNYSNSVLIGFNSGGSLKTAGSNNTFVGYDAGVITSTGANNTLLGYRAGYDLTTGSNNIIIGQNIASQIATGDNQLSIGNVIFATGGFGFGTNVGTGFVGIGTATPGARLQVGNAGDGSVALANAWNLLSDCRLKTNLTKIDNPLHKVNQLNGYYFNWKEGDDKSRQIGLIAQEVEKVIPEVVDELETGYKSVSYSKLISVLIEAVKELDTKVENLENENSGLRAQNNQLKILTTEIESIKKAIGSGSVSITAEGSN